MTGSPIPPSNYILHNHVQYSHGISILQICLLVILAACGVYANPVLQGIVQEVADKASINFDIAVTEVGK
jgi:hypothetical protein